MNARQNPFFDTTAQRGSTGSITFPRGFLDFLSVSPGRRHKVGDQIATAAQRALNRHADGSPPPFVQSRMASLMRLERMALDDAWRCSDECRRQVSVIKAYRNQEQDLIPDELPVVGLLDDAVLVDVAMQLLRSELGDYEDFCRFRKVAAEFAGIPQADTGLTRSHWVEAMIQAKQSLGRIEGTDHNRFGPDPRASLFHIA